MAWEDLRTGRIVVWVLTDGWNIMENSIRIGTREEYQKASDDAKQATDGNIVAWRILPGNLAG